MGAYCLSFPLDRRAVHRCQQKQPLRAIWLERAKFVRRELRSQIMIYPKVARPHFGVWFPVFTVSDAWLGLTLVDCARVSFTQLIVKAIMTARATAPITR